MFTWAQIEEMHGRLGLAETLADYLRGLAALGVVRFESFVSDGHTEFFGAGGQRVVSPTHHEVLRVAEDSDRDAFLEHLRQHVARETSYLDMSRGLADSGVEKWVADTAALTMTYRGRDGVVLLVDQID
jgi:uncharacterized protein YbcV (DUF1398 family)